MTAGEFGQILIGLAATSSAALSWRNSLKIEQVHKATNSMKDELVSEVRKASLAEGLQQGRDEAKGD